MPETSHNLPSTKDHTFLRYLLTVKRNHLLIAILSIVIQFIFLKTLFPYPNFIKDSHSYLAVAILNADVGEWPIGYSKFLLLFHHLTNSGTALTFFQFFLLETAVLYFVFTIEFILKPAKHLSNILFAILLYNPLFLLISNYISSDALFTALSFLWITQICWTVYRPSMTSTALHAVILLLAFTVRYNALYYPLISVLAYILCPLQWWAKITGILLPLLLISCFVYYTSSKNAELTGKSQFSAFGGWQIANNALNMYGHVKKNALHSNPSELFELDSFTRSYFDHSKNYNYFVIGAGTYFLWSRDAPLRQYLDYTWQKDSSNDYFKKWVSMGPLYSAYGFYLIKQYPFAYLKYFIWPNVNNYLLPPLESLNVYNDGTHTSDPITQNWFGYKSNAINHPYKGFYMSILNYYPVLAAFITLCFLLGITGFFLFNGLKVSERKLTNLILIIASLWFINFLFSIFSSPIVFRYQIFALFVVLPFSFLLLDFLHRSKPKNKPDPVLL
jgi:hypothetical protein